MRFYGLVLGEPVAELSFAAGTALVAAGIFLVNPPHPRYPGPMTNARIIPNILLALALASAWLGACSSGAGGDPDAGDTAADADADTDADGDADADTDTGTGTETDTGDPWTDIEFTLLTYNVGHPDADDPFYPLRLQSQDYEDHMAAVFQQLAPDIVVLREVLSAKTCEAFVETDPSKTCWQWDERPRPAARLLGPDYSVVCDARDHVECMRIGINAIPRPELTFDPICDNQLTMKTA